MTRQQLAALALYGVGTLWIAAELLGLRWKVELHHVPRALWRRRRCLLLRRHRDTVLLTGLTLRYGCLDCSREHELGRVRRFASNRRTHA